MLQSNGDFIWRDRQYTYNLISPRVLINILLWGNIIVFRVCCWAKLFCPLCKNIEFCTTNFYGKIFFAGHNNTRVGLHLKCPIVHWNKKNTCFLKDLLIPNILLTGLNTRRVLPRFLCFGTGCEKRFTRQAELISDEEISVRRFECLSLFVPHSSGMQITFSSASHYFVFCCLLRCTITVFSR